MSQETDGLEEKLGDLLGKISFLLDDFDFRIIPVSDIPEKNLNDFRNLLVEISELADDVALLDEW